MKFGVREICDVVLKAKATMKVGNKTFYKGEPVIYFDTLKSSGMEGTSTTVYAQGGRGNARLMAWEGEKTVTFTMEDALISPVGFMILSGAGLIDGDEKNPIPVHVHEQTNAIYTTGNGADAYIVTDKVLSDDPKSTIYVMAMENGEIISEPFIGKKQASGTVSETFDGTDSSGAKKVVEAAAKEGKVIVIKGSAVEGYTATDLKAYFYNEDPSKIKSTVVMADYYTDRKAGASQINITPDSFGGNFYLEASTLFRNTDGVDMPAEFIIPNCKIQSNFNFQMAASGDPSTFTFTMDAFPDYTRFNDTTKVLAAIQIVEESKAEDNETRKNTNHIDQGVGA